MDLLNYHYHLAVRAGWDGRLADTRGSLQDLLRLNPNSVVAYVELGSGYVQESDCARASEAVQKVMDLLSAGADPEHWLHDCPPNRAEWIQNARALLRRCGR